MKKGEKYDESAEEPPGAFHTRKFLIRDLSHYLGPVVVFVLWVASLRQLPADITRLDEALRDQRAAILRLSEIVQSNAVDDRGQEERLKSLERSVFGRRQ